MKPATLLQRLRVSRLREAIAGLMVAAFLLSALVPAGYMPAVQGPGLLQLCTALGARSVPDNPSAPAPDHAERHSTALCGFAAAPALAAPPALPGLVPIAVAPPLPVAASSLGGQRARDGPPREHAARAPPLLSQATSAG